MTQFPSNLAGAKEGILLMMGYVEYALIEDVDKEWG